MKNRQGEIEEKSLKLLWDYASKKELLLSITFQNEITRALFLRRAASLIYGKHYAGQLPLSWQLLRKKPRNFL